MHTWVLSDRATAGLEVHQPLLDGTVGASNLEVKRSLDLLHQAGPLLVT